MKPLHISIVATVLVFAYIYQYKPACLFDTNGDYKQIADTTIPLVFPAVLMVSIASYHFADRY